MSKKSPYDVFKTSSVNEEKGVALDYGEFAIVIKRAGPSNKKYVQMMTAINDKHGRAIRLGSIDEEELEKQIIEVFAKTIVVDWREVTDAEGNPLPFSVDNCIKLLTDLPDLFADIRNQAASFETFREEEIEEAVGN